MKWNHEARMYMYSTIVDYFGPYKEWAYRTSPGDKNIRYKEVLEIIADGLAKDGRYGSRPTPEAVGNQILLVLRPGGMLGNVGGVVRNMSAALESGFVTPSDLKDMGFRLTHNKSDMSDKYAGIEEVEAEMVRK